MKALLKLVTLRFNLVRKNKTYTEQSLIKCLESITEHFYFDITKFYV